MPLLVQSAHNTGSGTSVTVTLGSGTTAGNCLVVPAGASASGVPSVSTVKLGGSADNFALAKKTSQAGSFDVDCEIWTDQNCAGSQTSVVVTFAASTTDPAAYAEEWSGINTTGAVDATNGTGGTSTSWSSGATGTLSQASEVIVAAAYCFTSGSLTITGPGSPWTNLTQLGTSGGGLLGGYQIVSATTSQTYSGTQSAVSFEVNAAVIVSLKAGVPVSGSDTGSGADTATISVSSSDTGSGAESGSVAAALSSAETGSGADLGAVGVTSGETGSGADTASPPPAALTAPDTGTGAEGAPSVRFTAPDTGSGADAGTAVLGASGSEAGSGAESSSISVAVSGADAGAGAESSAIAATLPASADTGSGADAGKVGVSSGDTGTEGDNATQAPFIAPPIVLWNAPDKLSKRGGTFG